MSEGIVNASNSRLLFLPDELLQIILSLVDHPTDRRNVALSCSRLRRLSRRTPHALRLEFYSRSKASNPREWLKTFDDYSRVFTHVKDLTVEITRGLGNQLMAGIAAGCPKLKKLKLVVAAWDSFNVNGRAWRNLAKQCPLLASLKLSSRISYTRQPSLPPVHLFPSLHSLSLLYVPSDYLSIPHCSSLTSLTLGAPESSTLSSLAFSSSSLVSSSSSSLESSPPSSLRSSLTSLTIHCAELQGALASLAFFPSLASLSLHSCTIDPYELSSLSRSLHSLTHLTIHSCPLVSSHSLIPILQANPALTSLSLHGTTYRLFGPQGFRALLSHCSSQLHSLSLAGFPCFSPGVFAACTALRSLSVEGMSEVSDSVSPCRVSLDGIAGMLVRVVQTGGGTGGEAGGEAGEEAGGEAGGDGGLEGGADVWERGRASVPAAAAEAPVLPRVSNQHWGKYVDIRTEAEAAQADKLLAVREVFDFVETATQTSRAACPSFGKIRFGISVCRSGSDMIREYNAAMDWEEKLMKSAAAVACRAAGYFSTEVNGGEEEVRDGEEEGGYEILDSTPADEALPERVLGGERSGAVETHMEAMRRLEALVDMLQEAARGMCDSSRTMRKPPVLTAASLRSGAVAAAVADGRATLHGVGGVAAEVADGRVPVNRVGGGAPQGLQQAESALEDGGLLGPAAGEVATGKAAAGKAAAEFSRIRPVSFQSIARAAVFGKLKRLALLFCSGLEEEEWLELLAACVKLEELKVQHSDKFSDAVVVGSRLGALASLTVIRCDKVTAAGIGEVLRSFPRLRFLEVEVGKVLERARRELLRAGVIVRGV
ncbi:unnamed protein product [Closterium sp. Yama58-4]|nr:unnamed protein product [Closterium sp. Yama58-4]